MSIKHHLLKHKDKLRTAKTPFGEATVFPGKGLPQMVTYSKPLGLFEEVPVRLLREFRGSRNRKHKVGEQAHLLRIPSGEVMLSAGIVSLERNPEEGVDFEFA